MHTHHTLIRPVALRVGLVHSLYARTIRFVRALTIQPERPKHVGLEAALRCTGRIRYR